MDQQSTTSSRRSGSGTIRTQYQKINYVTLLIAAPLASLVALYTSSLNPTAAPFLAGSTIIIAMPLIRFLIMKFGVGTFLLPKGPFVEDIANRSDEKILVNEFVKLGGKGASRAAAKLKNNIGSVTLTLTAEA
jgi:hypothetical protein